MSSRTVHPLAEDYLRRLQQAARRLPADRRAELESEIEEHLAEAIAPGASDEQALEVIERLGPPGEIVEAEQPAAQAPADRRTWREWAAVILLPLGGFVFGVGWLAGVVLLWSSQLWTIRDKLIGTLIVPGGIATALLVGVATATKRECVTFVGPAGGPFAGHVGTHCTPSGGPGTAADIWHGLLIALCVIGPIVTAIYLARRARTGAAGAAAARG